jgi:beta-phosphoglucomutase-like phosphatase (HAD superfamily)
VVEDSLTGITSGLAAGAKVIGIPNIQTLAPNKRLLQVKNLKEIDLTLLKNWWAGN